MNSIKNFIVDFGGVVYKINEAKTLKAFFELSQNPVSVLNENEKQWFLGSGFIKFQKGIISPARFRKQIINKYKLDCNFKQFDAAWNSMLISLFPNAVDCIGKLKNIGKVVLLSNTNVIHYKHFYRESKELFSILDACFFSHKLGLNKPDPEIFEFVLNKMKFKASETLFIDDTIENIQAAEKLGLATYHINENSLSDIFSIL